jgi:hypothetical protein
VFRTLLLFYLCNPLLWTFFDSALDFHYFMAFMPWVLLVLGLTAFAKEGAFAIKAFMKSSLWVLACTYHTIFYQSLLLFFFLLLNLIVNL